VRVLALAMASASNDVALEQIVGRLSLEPQVSGASWQVDHTAAES
jgi:putative Mg2+ transporter-C (MgtC) family protein